MAQHDYNISNATGANFRADLNNALQAIVTQNSGSTLPMPTFPGMLWLDLSGGGDGVMRRRNQANTAWLSDLGIDQTARDAAAAAQVTANAAMPRAGGTFTGAVNLIPGEPSGNQAMSRAAADALYQVKLPVASAGSLLLGTAGGWATSMPVGSAGAVLAVSGGAPVWQNTGTSAAPGILVRTIADGTIDPSFIPAVASGLRFRGTFKPAVNAEYPTTGGSGAAGAPAVGDFWVIDGLTTGGYTYLTGSLAGVTVYNGDSIAFNGTGQWFRMGSVVNVEGYLKTDGSNAMAAALNLGGFPINNVNGIAGMAGSPVPLTNFRIDTSNILISPQRGTTGAPLANMQSGQLGTDLGNMQVLVGYSGGNAGLIPIRYFSTTAAYLLAEYVVNGGQLYKARQAISAGAFTPSQWYTVVDTGGASFVGNIEAPKITAGPDGSNGLKLVIGNDAGFWDIGQANTMALRGITNADEGALQFGNGPTLSRWNAGTILCSGVMRFGVVAGEGGEICLAGGPGRSDAIIDSEGENIRFFGGSAVPMAFDRGTGQLRGVTKMFATAYQVSVPAGSETYVSFAMADREVYLFANDVTKAVGIYDTTAAKVRISTAANGDFITAGRMGVNGATPGTGDVDAIRVNGGVNSLGGQCGFLLSDRDNGAFVWQLYANAGGFNIYRNTPGVNLLTVMADGRVIAQQFVPTSDMSLKNDIGPYTARPFLPDNIQLHRFTWKNGGADAIGAYAQEIEVYAPEYVGETANGLKTVDFTSLLLESVVALTARVVALESLTEH